jgi:hypothetical protein
MKFNKKQRAYLDRLVEESPTKMILTQKLYERNSFVDEDVARLGRVWENQLTDIDRYVSDKFIEVHGAKMQQYY